MAMVEQGLLAEQPIRRWAVANRVVDLLRAYPNGLSTLQLCAKLGYRYRKPSVLCAVFYARRYLGAHIVTENPKSRYSKYRLVA